MLEMSDCPRYQSGRVVLRARMIVNELNSNYHVAINEKIKHREEKERRRRKNVVGVPYEPFSLNPSKRSKTHL